MTSQSSVPNLRFDDFDLLILNRAGPRGELGFEKFTNPLVSIVYDCGDSDTTRTSIIRETVNGGQRVREFHSRQRTLGVKKRPVLCE